MRAVRSYKHDVINIDRMRFRGVVHPSVWKAAKRGERRAIRMIIDDLKELSLMGGFIGGVYRRAARRLVNIELCLR